MGSVPPYSYHFTHVGAMNEGIRRHSITGARQRVRCNKQGATAKKKYPKSKFIVTTAGR